MTPKCNIAGEPSSKKGLAFEFCANIYFNFNYFMHNYIGYLLDTYFHIQEYFPPSVAASIVIYI